MSILHGPLVTLKMPVTHFMDFQKKIAAFWNSPGLVEISGVDLGALTYVPCLCRDSMVVKGQNLKQRFKPTLG